MLQPKKIHTIYSEPEDEAIFAVSTVLCEKLLQPCMQVLMCMGLNLSQLYNYTSLKMCTSPNALICTKITCNQEPLKSEKVHGLITHTDYMFSNE